MKLRSLIGRIAAKLHRKTGFGGAGQANPLAAALASGRQDWIRLYFKLRLEQAIRE